MNENVQHIKKFVIFGSSYTGKTYVASRFQEIQYNSYIETIGVDFNVVNFKQLPLLAHIHGKLQMWDTAGLDRFININPSYYRNAAIILIVFSFSDLYSFQKCKEYAQNAFKYCQQAQILLIGNHFQENCVVSVDEAVDFAHFNNFQFFELNSSNFEQLKTLVQKNVLKTIV
ncbi:Rab11 [Hexamita inflata]|uniref:Rab11 n=1 Tax=Hexamita inflata TaxID=28002 RepID=A0AA86RSN2_9EUKA|nr:Rab11 [Hexamita inflata]